MSRFCESGCGMIEVCGRLVLLRLSWKESVPRQQSPHATHPIPSQTIPSHLLLTRHTHPHPPYIHTAQVTTSHFLLTDMDLWPSRGMYPLLRRLASADSPPETRRAFLDPKQVGIHTYVCVC
jgi:hypothetical protein